jgi:hypothetical protein
MKRTLTASVVLAATIAIGGGTPATAQDQPILGPEGYKQLHVGQPGAEAEATGLLVNKQSDGCDRYYLHPDEGEQNIGSGVFIDPTLGVVMIGGTTESQTPEGVGMGSTFAEVEAAYPDLAPVPPTDFVYSASVPGHDVLYRFAFDGSNEVSDFALHPRNMGTCATTLLGPAAPFAAGERVRMWEDAGAEGSLYVDYQPGQVPRDDVQIDYWDGDDEISAVNNNTDLWLMMYDSDSFSGDKVCIAPGDYISNLELIGFDNSAESFKLRNESFCK